MATHREVLAALAEHHGQVSSRECEPYRTAVSALTVAEPDYRAHVVALARALRGLSHAVVTEPYYGETWTQLQAEAHRAGAALAALPDDVRREVEG